jgi:hypothetical protein
LRARAQEALMAQNNKPKPGSGGDKSSGGGKKK